MNEQTPAIGVKPGAEAPDGSPAIRVRPAREADIAAAAAILVEGFRSKFEAAFDERVDRAESVVARTLALEAPRGLPGLFVAEADGQVVGTVALRRHSDPDAPEWDSAGILFDELGLWGGLRAMFYFSLLDQPCGWQEVYVSDVAVAGPVRRRGVGQALLRHAETVARSWGKQALVLDVTARNEAARQLYRKLGYIEQRLRRSLLAHWLLKEGEWVRMRKELETSGERRT
jgi:ribosomal protein S18 acetylase RimI-like enzyme